ncbi:MAG: helix-turn-helix domain-containing protein [Geobacteraceae bacterium]
MIDAFDSDEHISAGQKLRKTRMDRGVDLDEVARVTRITKGYLLALEADAHDKLPSEAYARGFLRIYANFLELPAEEVLTLYQRGACETTQEELVPVTPRVRAARSKKVAVKPWLWSFAAVCLAVLIGYFFLVDKEQGATSETKSMQLSQPEDYVVRSTENAPPNSEKTAENPSQNLSLQSENTTSNTSVTHQGIVLKMRALEDGFLKLTIDDTITQQYDLKAGDIIEWKADRFFSLDMENAGGVEAELNGKLLRPFGTKGSPAHIILSAGYDGEKTKR